MTTYINIYGGPGIGKSTTAAKLFHQMKIAGYDVELVTEVAKDLTWEKRIETLKIQPYVIIKQYRNLVRLKDKIDFVVTDSPILMGLAYADLYNADLPDSYWQLIKDLHAEVLNPSINVMLKRKVAYNPNGRNQDEAGAKALDTSIWDYVIHERVVVLSPEDTNLETLRRNFKELK